MRGIDQGAIIFSSAFSLMAHDSPSDVATFASLLPDGIELKAEDLKNQASNTA